jgi:hypothetical protein
MFLTAVVQVQDFMGEHLEADAEYVLAPERRDESTGPYR